MKKALLTIGIILVALGVMAPAPDKAEKLRFDETGWERDVNHSLFTIDMSCHFGMATAAEANGKFTVTARVDVFKHDGNGWDKIGYVEKTGIPIVKAADTKDADGFIAVNSEQLEWNGDDDGNGTLAIDVTLGLVGPSGKVMSSTYVPLADTHDPICPGEPGCGGGDIPTTH